MDKNFFLIILFFIQYNIIKTLNSEKIILENEIGEIGNYTYELWKDTVDPGRTTMILGKDGKFSCSWENVRNVLFRIGKRWNSTQTYKEIGKIKVKYEFDFNSNGTDRYAIYGWTKQPLIEYYILENWEGYVPNTNKFASLFVDGSNYDMYKVDLTSFDSDRIIQLWSIRTKKRNKGTVSVNEHFKTWEKFGYKLGKLYEVTFCVEGYKSFGNANITKNEIIIE